MTENNTQTEVLRVSNARPMLKVQELHHVYGSKAKAYTALDSVSFEVRTGELVSIVGPSGSGKTTLLRLLAGLIVPTSGLIEVDGRKVTGVPAELAMVFQDYGRSLFPWLTVGANIRFPLTRLRLGKSEVNHRIQESLKAVGLAGAESKSPWQLSGGMQQRVAIARALAYQPSLLLMDEPFASVDAQTRSDLQDLVLSVRREFEITIGFVTHDIDESVYLADRIVVLSSPPTRVAAEFIVDLPRDRDQISTRELDNFVSLRGEVARVIRGMSEPSKQLDA